MYRVRARRSREKARDQLEFVHAPIIGDRIAAPWRAAPT
jgi:hypothetical protein